jgi:hypothetical protein
MPIVLQTDIGIPFPFDTQPEEITVWRDRAKTAVATILEIIRLGGNVTIDDEDRSKARNVATGNAPLQITEDNAGALIHLEAILSEYDKGLLNTATRLRSYVTNKLLLETIDEDAKVRIKALELLGKITNVGLFSERIDINVTHRTVEEIDSELDNVLEKFLGPVERVDTETAQELDSLLAMTDEEIGIVDVEFVDSESTDDNKQSTTSPA